MAQGQIISVRLDYSTTINNRHPWIVAYAFATPRGMQQGTDQGFDDMNGYRMPGDPVWVVYVDGEPDCSAVWPPVR